MAAAQESEHQKPDSQALTRAQRWVVLGVSALLLGAAVTMIVFSLRTPAVEEFAPTPPDPAPAGDTLVGPRTYTVDASDPDAWRYFDFSRGSVVSSPGPTDWDLAFRRFHVVANGGAGFAGRGGLLNLGEVPFDSVQTVPASGYVPTEVGTDTTSAATEDWYRYSFTSHLLRPRPRTYAVRTADGRYAKLRIVGYYCEGAQPGCLTFRYVYQGDGSRGTAPTEDPHHGMP